MKVRLHWHRKMASADYTGKTDLADGNCRYGGAFGSDVSVGGQRIMQAYLDNSATTRCSEGVRDIVVKVMMEDFGNPSSRHDKGMEAEKYLREARMDIAATLKADEKEIYFTSGGTESDNWALIGTAMANKRAWKTHYYNGDRTCCRDPADDLSSGAGI